MYIEIDIVTTQVSAAMMAVIDVLSAIDCEVAVSMSLF